MLWSILLDLESCESFSIEGLLSLILNSFLCVLSWDRFPIELLFFICHLYKTCSIVLPSVSECN